jgi:hypothetical protein
MAEQLILKSLPFIRILPNWAQELAYKYCSKTANLYIVHGNIRDFLPHKMNDDEFNFVKIQDYIAEVLFGNRDIIIFYDRSSGVTFLNGDMKREYLMAMNGSNGTNGSNTGDRESVLSRDPMDAFPVLERFCYRNVAGKRRIVVIIDYAETILPNTDISRFTDEDRYCLVTLNR